MPKSINDFIAQVSQQSFVKSANFDVIVTGPTSLGGQSDTSGLNFRTDTVEIPGRQVSTSDFRTYGPIQKIAYDQIHSDISMTVMLSQDLSEKQFFQRWQDMAIGLARGSSQVSPGMFNLGYYDNYKGTVQINQYNDRGEQIYTCRLLEAWPVTLTGLTADWSSTDIQRLQVSFAYRYFIDDEGFAESFNQQNQQTTNPGDPDTSGDLTA